MNLIGFSLRLVLQVDGKKSPRYSSRDFTVTADFHVTALSVDTKIQLPIVNDNEISEKFPPDMQNAGGMENSFQLFIYKLSQ